MKRISTLFIAWMLITSVCLAPNSIVNATASTGITDDTSTDILNDIKRSEYTKFASSNNEITYVGQSSKYILFVETKYSEDQVSFVYYYSTDLITFQKIELDTVNESTFDDGNTVFHIQVYCIGDTFYFFTEGDMKDVTYYVTKDFKTFSYYTIAGNQFEKGYGCITGFQLFKSGKTYYLMFYPDGDISSKQVLFQSSDLKTWKKMKLRYDHEECGYYTTLGDAMNIGKNGNYIVFIRKNAKGSEIIYGTTDFNQYIVLSQSIVKKVGANDYYSQLFPMPNQKKILRLQWDEKKQSITVAKGERSSKTYHTVATIPNIREYRWLYWINPKNGQEYLSILIRDHSNKKYLYVSDAEFTKLKRTSTKLDVLAIDSGSSIGKVEYLSYFTKNRLLVSKAKDNFSKYKSIVSPLTYTTMLGDFKGKVFAVGYKESTKQTDYGIYTIDKRKFDWVMK